MRLARYMRELMRFFREGSAACFYLTEVKAAGSIPFMFMKVKDATF